MGTYPHYCSACGARSFHERTELPHRYECPACGRRERQNPHPPEPSAGPSRHVAPAGERDGSLTLADQLVATGGGWYLLPNGERVKGKAAAVEALRAIVEPPA